VDYDALYEIRAAVSRRRQQITYMGLSQAYHASTGEWHEPHGGWDDALGELNRRLFGAGHHPLSAVVILKGTLQPGGRFWESSPNVPRRPKQRRSENRGIQPDSE
jgi:hypothetical protein